MVVEIAHLNQDFLVQAVPEGFPCIGWCLVNNMHTHRCLRNPCCQHEEPLCCQHCVCWWAQHIATHWPSLMASVWLCAGTLMINFLLFHLKVKLNYYDYTLECHYNAVQYIMILLIVMRWQQQNISQILNSQKTPVVMILEKIYRIFSRLCVGSHWISIGWSTWWCLLMSWAPSQYKDRLIYVWRFPC